MLPETVKDVDALIVEVGLSMFRFIQSLVNRVPFDVAVLMLV